VLKSRDVPQRHSTRQRANAQTRNPERANARTRERANAPTGDAASEGRASLASLMRPRRSRRPKTALPGQPSPLIGCDREIALATRLLTTPGVRLVTITGPAGAGKTRLALELGTSYVSLARATLPGEFRALPTNGHEQYFPDVQASSDGRRFTVKP
jgi:ATP-dependent Clp protease ATP-binding subunit ClpA